MADLADATSRALFGITHAKPPRQSRRMARYDAADTNDNNQRHWADADNLSARAANTFTVRQKLRSRARLEADNGGNCKGMIETIGHDLVGTGPRLQLTLPQAIQQQPQTTVDQELATESPARTVERKFGKWAMAIGLADKLRVMSESETRDGECFGLFTNNPINVTPDQPIELDVRVVECDQVETPTPVNPYDPTAQVSGIEFDRHGNPAFYHVLKAHPGDLLFILPLAFDRVPADRVLHWFRPSRAGQFRGIPRITPGLPLIAQLRGYARSVLGAARIAAMFAAVMKTNLPPAGGEAVDVEEYDKIPLDHDGLFTLPAGWDLNQLRAEQPTTSYGEFTNHHLTQFGRSCHVPRNVVTGDSSGYNFSSARLDHLIYRGAIRVERSRLRRLLDRIFLAWLAEAALIPGYLPDGLPAMEFWAWQWQYDGVPSINPVDDATADATNLENGLTSHAQLLAENGIDWEEHFESIARQREKAKALGIEDLLWPAQAKAAQLPKSDAAAAGPGGNRTNEGSAGKPQQHGAEWQAEHDTVLDLEEVTSA